MSETLSTGPLRGPLRRKDSKIWARHENDWYVEPEWCSRRLFEQEEFRGSIFDPACGGGNILKSARAAGYHAYGNDVVRRSEYADTVANFLNTDFQADNIVSNPPFGLCDDRKAKRHPWPEHCLKLAKFKVALLMPANWVQGDQRSRWLQESPLYRVWFISPRPSMPPGEVLAAGMKPGNGTTDYAWFVWLHGYSGAPTIHWLRREA